MCLSIFLEKLNFHYTFQGAKYANGICSFYTIFNILFCFKKPFYVPCVVAVTQGMSKMVESALWVYAEFIEKLGIF